MNDPINGSKYTFLPWLRQGISTAIGKTDSRAIISAGVEVNNKDTVKVDIKLYGPQDITGIDARIVVRTDPRNGTTDFEPNYFPAIEFYNPAFPWLFTPVSSIVKDRLRPWICLVVVRKQDAKLDFSPGNPLPILLIDVSELPDLDESWAWAHVQITGAADSGLKQELKTHPEKSLSRLICPRKLEPNTQYYACLVPAFKQGVNAGLGLEVDENAALELAWDKNTNSSIPLPVYFHWEFSTGVEGDFESVVRRIKLREQTELHSEIGVRRMDMRKPGGNFEIKEDYLELEGVLRCPGKGSNAPKIYYKQFKDILYKPEEARMGKSDPIIAPPIYGGIYAESRPLSSRYLFSWDGIADTARLPGKENYKLINYLEDYLRYNFELEWLDPIYAIIRKIDNGNTIKIKGPFVWPPDQQNYILITLNDEKTIANLTISNDNRNDEFVANLKDDQINIYSSKSPAWLRELNFDPRYRVAAGLGTIVIQKNQESFMASAWVQLGEIKRANQLLHQSQLACAVGGAILDNHLKLMESSSMLLQVTQPAQTRILSGTKTGTKTIQKKILESPVPVAATSPSFLKITRPFGRIKRRQIKESKHYERKFVVRFDAGNITAAPPRKEAAALVALEKIPLFKKYALPDKKVLDPPESYDKDLKDAAENHLAYLHKALKYDDKQPIRKGLMDYNYEPDFNQQLRKSLDPNKTISSRVIARIPERAIRPIYVNLYSEKSTGDQYNLPAPMIFSPEFSQPMFEKLKDIAQDHILPGIGHIPPNSLVLLEQNFCFIEAYIVGLNHEMSRELLWRGFPTDQRGTYFRQFWDTRGYVPSKEERKSLSDINFNDIPPIDIWGEKKLGESLGGIAGNWSLVLLIRSDLLRRFPTAMIYAAKGKLVQEEGKLKRKPSKVREDEKYPRYRITFDPDITLLGFDLAWEDAIGDANNLGWFFVIQQQPTEMRFGLDVATSDFGRSFEEINEGGWRNLRWSDLVENDKEFNDLTHVRIGECRLQNPTQLKINKATWGENSAHMASITLRPPIRIDIHASVLLPRESGESDNRKKSV